MNFNELGFDLKSIDFTWRYFFSETQTPADNELPIGYISREIRLYTTNYSSFISGFRLSFDENSELQSKFTIYPPYLRASLNDPYLSFLIGAKPDTPAGVYRFNLQRLGTDTKYVRIPPALQMIVTQRACGLI